MTYNPSIPTSADYLSISQRQFLTNYAEVYRQFGEDHVNFDDDVESKRGKHNKMGFAEQSSDPSTSATDVALYTKNNVSQPELFIRKQSDGNIFRATKNGRIAPALRLEAYVIFDYEGNIIKDRDNTPLSYNVASVVPQTVVSGRNTKDDWLINFTNNISTQYYFWMINATLRPRITVGGSGNGTLVTTNPFKTATYADSVKVGSFRVQNKTNGFGDSIARFGCTMMEVQIYTVA